ncbi:KICSTOR complex protein C12orf66 [Entomortierella parvispora]|uniref:KICSTOR complex protein C12orf66 n=1 Tax=Entomortierella parvispora TaxID=205924 RepID=A0A9P3M061_9FUNG|nr:KICSTOR complex protein C12orf66 [Entomortierella parvispora]
MFSRDCAEYIKALGSFDYACANKHMMRLSKVHPTAGFFCSRISQAEGIYTSMQFLKPKIFRREDHLYHFYSELVSDIERELSQYHDSGSGSIAAAESSRRKSVRQSSSGHTSPILGMSESSHVGGIQQQLSKESPNNTRSGELTSANVSPTNTLHLQSGFQKQEDVVADQLLLYTILRELCILRMLLIGIYRKLSLSTVEIEASEILPEAEYVLEVFNTKVKEIQQTVLGAGLHCEILALVHGLLMHKAVVEYEIQKSATNLYLAGTSLSEWRRMTLEQEYAEKSLHRPEETPWHYSLFSSGEDKSKSNKSGKLNLHPNHLLWLGRWIASEKTKMTLYFMDNLLEKEQLLGGDERTLWANMDPDLHGLIRIFRKKAGAHSVSFVYQISPEVRFSPTGFVSANAPYESPTGLNSFPCIYSYPPDPPRDHWPNIISIMQGSINILQQYRTQYFYDRKIGCTYYVARVDPHVSMVVIYLDKHPQPDQGAMDFVQQIVGRLRHTDVLVSMRTE